MFATLFESEVPTVRSIDKLRVATSIHDEHPFMCANCTQYQCKEQYPKQQ
jgi:hypothetical protein